MEKGKANLFQKWWFWVCIVLIVCVISSIVILSNSNKNTSTGITTTYSDTSNNSRERSQKTISDEELKSNIEIEPLGIVKNGDFVIKVNNNNDVPICISDLEVIFKDNNNNFIEKKEVDSSFFGIDKKSETVVYVYSYSDDNFTKYSNYEFNYEFANIYDSFVYSNFEINANNTGKQISVTVKNNNDIDLSSILVNVVYYFDNQIVGCETGYANQTTTSANGTAYINVDYPENSDYDKVKFNDYKVYLVQAGKAY